MKKNIIILSVVIVIFVVSLIFFVFAINLNPKNIEDSDQNNTVMFEEDEPYSESQTEDIDNVIYKDFTIYRDDNSELKLSEFQNTPIMLLFFNSENEDSIKVLQKVESVYKNFQNNMKFLMINTSQEVDENLKNEYSIEIYYDFYKEAVRNYNITELPSMIFITKDNNVFNAKSGLISTDALDANLNILIENY